MRPPWGEASALFAGDLPQSDAWGDCSLKLLCVPFKDPTWSHMHDISDIRPSLLDEIAHFFDVYKDLEHGADTVVGGWHDRVYADEIIAEGRAAFSAASR
jgi:inorganic pyrophosphatase